MTISYLAYCRQGSAFPSTPLPVLMELYDRQLAYCRRGSASPSTPLPVLMGLYDRQLPGLLSPRERLPIHTPPCPNGIV
jgi:hypothetical protein